MQAIMRFALSIFNAMDRGRLYKLDKKAQYKLDEKAQFDEIKARRHKS